MGQAPQATANPLSIQYGIIESAQQVHENLAYLERARLQAPTSPGFVRYQEPIRRGACFLPYSINRGLAFGPSRFIGYALNTFDGHDRRAKHGRPTNKAISSLFGDFVPDKERADLEDSFKDFCKSIGFEAPTHGTFRNERKYWRPTQIDRYVLAEREIRSDPNLSITSKEQLVLARRGQGDFRNRLVDKWQGRCSVSGYGRKEILRASHIKPWCESNNDERLDVFNGLLLTPNLDALFDKKLISFADDGGLLLAEGVTLADLKALGVQSNARVSIEERHKPHLEHHRGNHFWQRP